MARDRKRTRPRRGRQPRRDEAAAPGAPPNGETPAPGQLHRADVPGALQHASSEVDEFDAALVRGAGGVAVEAAREGEALAESETDATVSAEASAPPAEAPERAAERRGAGEPRRGWPSRAAAFLRASWAELQRVQWPDRPQVSQATAVVIGFVAVAGLYLGLADWVAQKIVSFVL
jgi:preprotein translocase subunit SecE